MERLFFPEKDAYVNQHTHDTLHKLLDDDLNGVYTVYNPPVVPFEIIFDLYTYSICTIQQLRYYVNNGNASTQKYYIVRRDTGERVLIHSYTGGGWIQAEQIVNIPSNLQFNASFFIIQSQNGADFPNYLQMWGTQTARTLPPPAIVPAPLWEKVGACVKPWDIDFYMYPEKGPVLQSLGLKRVRLYNDYEVNHNDDGTWNINEFRQINSMQALKAAGIEVQMCYLALPPAYPWPPTGDKNNVATYLQLAQDVYYLCLHNKNNGEYFKYFELLNEQDAWYHPDVNYHFNGYQLAAMYSMCYDGHKGAYSGVGLKASGTAAKFATGGVAEAEPYLFYQMLEWCRANRGYKTDGTVDLPFDAYSFHCYSSLGGQFEFSNPGGTPPEIGAAPYFEKINTLRRRYAWKTRIHVGEGSGGDVSQSSPLRATAFGPYDGNKVSAMWTVRFLLALAEHDIDAFAYYRISQDFPDYAYDNSPVQFNTMALVRSESGGVKQPDGTYREQGMHRVITGDYFKQIAENLFNAGYVFDSRISTTPNVLKFTKPGNNLYAIWATETMTVDLNVYGQQPAFTENVGFYDIGSIAGTIKRFKDDGSGVMTSQVFNGGSIAYNSNPVLLITGDVPIPPAEFVANVPANVPTVVVARQTISFQAAGLDVTNTRIVYEVGSPIKSWAPDRQVNAISGFEAEKGYYLISKVDLDLRQFLIPPIDPPGPLL